MWSIGNWISWKSLLSMVVNQYFSVFDCLFYFHAVVVKEIPFLHTLFRHMATEIPTMFYRGFFCQVETHVNFMNRPTFGQYRISVLLLAERSLTGCSKPQLCEFFLEGKCFSSGGNIFGDTKSLSQRHTHVYLCTNTNMHPQHTFIHSLSVALINSALFFN